MESKLADKLYAIGEMIDWYERKYLNGGMLHLHEAIIISLKEITEDFLALESDKPTTPEPEPEQVEEAQPEPKRRARKKKAAEESEPVVEEPSRHRELVFNEGLDKDLASFSTIEGIDDDKIVNENLGPIPLANSLPKQGEHPFWKGPAQFVWYLPMERWSLYLADLLEAEQFYPSQLDLYDTKRLEEAKRVGVDIEFVTAIIERESKRMITIDDFKEADYADDDASLERLNEIKENGFLKKFVADVDPEKKLLKFLTRFGWNKGIIDDLETIYEEHTEHPNKYIHW